MYSVPLLLRTPLHITLRAHTLCYCLKTFIINYIFTIFSLLAFYLLNIYYFQYDDTPVTQALTTPIHLSSINITFILRDALYNNKLTDKFTFVIKNSKIHFMLQARVKHFSLGP